MEQKCGWLGWCIPISSIGATSQSIESSSNEIRQRSFESPINELRQQLLKEALKELANLKVENMQLQVKTQSIDMDVRYLRTFLGLCFILVIMNLFVVMFLVVNKN